MSFVKVAMVDVETLFLVSTIPTPTNRGEENVEAESKAGESPAGETPGCGVVLRSTAPELFLFEVQKRPCMLAFAQF